jgi:hypothetical protein
MHFGKARSHDAGARTADLHDDDLKFAGSAALRFVVSVATWYSSSLIQIERSRTSFEPPEPIVREITNLIVREITEPRLITPGS